MCNKRSQKYPAIVAAPGIPIFSASPITAFSGGLKDDPKRGWDDRFERGSRSSEVSLPSPAGIADPATVPVQFKC